MHIYTTAGEEREKETRIREYLIGGAVTVHLAVTSGIPLPVCGETLRGSFTSLHRSSKMAHPVLDAFSRGLSIFERTFKVTSSSPFNIGFDDPLPA